MFYIFLLRYHPMLCHGSVLGFQAIVADRIVMSDPSLWMTDHDNLCVLTHGCCGASSFLGSHM